MAVKARPRGVIVLLASLLLSCGASPETSQPPVPAASLDGEKAGCTERANGLAAYAGGDHKRALALLLPCAEAGDARSQEIVGTLYSVGIDVPHRESEAAKWYRKAAEQGLPSAQASLANCYVSGHGVQQNHQEAVRLFRAAAQHGDKGSQTALGLAYKYGWWGLAPDADAARFWTDRAQGAVNKRKNAGGAGQQRPHTPDTYPHIP